MSTNVLEVLLKATDQMSGVINNAVSNATSKLDALAKGTKAFANTAQNISQSSAAAALAVGGTMAHPIKMFAEYDEALAGFKTSIMDAQGAVDPEVMRRVEAYSVKLGNTFKGNSADMMKMFYELGTNGIQVEQVLGGLGEATAQYATLTHQSYETVGRSFGKLVNELGITNKALNPEQQGQAYKQFADQLQRAHYMGVKPEDMMYAFGRSAGGLKLLKQQGTEAFNAIVPMYAMMIRGGASGEKAGTNVISMFQNMIDAGKMEKANKALKDMGATFDLHFLNKEGEFVGIENMFKQLEQLQGMSTEKQAKVMKAIMGGGYDQQIAQNFIHSGTQGYREMEESMRRQADAATKLQEIQGTLGMTFENTMSIFNNVEIDWVRTFADDLKSLLREGVQPFLLGVQDWISNNRELARSIGLGLVAFTGLMAALAAVSGVGYIAAKTFSNLATMASGAFKAVGWLGRALGLLKEVTPDGQVVKGAGNFFSNLMNLGSAAATRLGGLARLAFTPWGLAAIVTAGVLYKYWTPINDFFGGLWQGIGDKTKGNTSNMQKALSDVGGWFAEGFPTVTRYAKAVGDFFSLTKEGHNQSWADKGKGIGNWFGDKISALDQWVGQSRQDGILSGTLWANVASQAKAGFSGMGSTIMSGLGPVMDIGSRIKSVMQNLSPLRALSMIGDGIPGMSALKGLGSNLMGNIGQIKLPDLSGLASKFTGLKEKIVGAFKGIGPAVAQAFSSIGTSISGALARAGAVMSAFISSARAKLVGGFQQMSAAARAAASAIASRLQAAFNSALAAAGAFVSGVVAKMNQMYSQVMSIAGRMFAAGRRIVENIARGISSGIGMVTAAIGRVAAAIMSHMPRSPAKEGPLRDIQKINIVGTIADTMRTAPIVKASERVAGAAKTSLSRGTGVLHSKSKAGNSNNHFSPTINVQGGGSSVKAEVEQALKVAFKQYARKERLGYAS